MSRSELPLPLSRETADYACGHAPGMETTGAQESQGRAAIAIEAAERPLTGRKITDDGLWTNLSQERSRLFCAVCDVNRRPTRCKCGGHEIRSVRVVLDDQDRKATKIGKGPLQGQSDSLRIAVSAESAPPGRCRAFRGQSASACRHRSPRPVVPERSLRIP